MLKAPNPRRQVTWIRRGILICTAAGHDSQDHLAARSQSRSAFKPLPDPSRCLMPSRIAPQHKGRAPRSSVGRRFWNSFVRARSVVLLAGRQVVKPGAKVTGQPSRLPEGHRVGPDLARSRLAEPTRRFGRSPRNAGRAWVLLSRLRHPADRPSPFRTGQPM